MTQHAPVERPLVLIVGGCDVHRRIDLMNRLATDYSVAAAGSASSLRRHFVRAGFDFHYYPLSRGYNPLDEARSLFSLTRLYRRLKPAIVHTFATKPSVWGRIAARLAGVPIIVGTLPGLGSLYVDGGIRRRLLRRVYEGLQKIACTLSDLTIFQNSQDACDLLSAGVVARHKMAVVPGSGVRTDLLDPARLSREARMQVRGEVGAGPDSVVVTMISRVIRSKGVLEFARAAEILAQQYPDVRFVLVGRDDRGSLECLDSDERAHVRRSVRWLGERRDISSILAATDVFVLPSFYREGIPRVLLEAASMGLPLVTTLWPGCAEVVEHGKNGLLVAPKDATALARAIERLAVDAELRQRLGSSSRQIAVSKFDLSVVAAQISGLYDSLMNGARMPRSAESTEHCSPHVARLGRGESARVTEPTSSPVPAASEDPE